VVLAVRNLTKGQAVADAIGAQTEVRRLDLADLASVQAFADSWTGDLDVLINNAGVMAVPLERTVDDFEPQIGANFLGHFALTNLLLPHITDRVVNVSSVLNRLGRIDLDDLNWQSRKYKPWRAYGQSKLASLLISGELQRRLTASGRFVRAVTAHPGVVRSHLGTHLAGGPQRLLFNLGVRINGTSTDVGARPILWAATQDIAGDSYIGPADKTGVPAETKRSSAESDTKIAHALWTLAESLTAPRLSPVTD
jgi:NAD(P)-dependent dehydrogenase (short-subunit alcohol dehydrogenase family)